MIQSKISSAAVKLRLEAAGLALLVSILLVTATAAHGPDILIKSDPADGTTLATSPPQVVAWFSSELETTSTLRVFNLEGQQVDNGDGGVDLTDPDHASMVVSLPPLPDGVYLVQWYAILADGDEVEGAFTFGVGKNKTAVEQAKASQLLPGSQNNGEATRFIIVAGIVVLLIIAIGGGWYLRRMRAR